MRRITPLLFLILVVNLASAQVEVFTEYNTKATLDGDILHVEKELSIKNNAIAPIIPGELHFQLYKASADGRKIAPEVRGLMATDYKGDPLSSSINQGSESTEVLVNVFEPLLPGFTYPLKVQYDIDFKPSGILFYEVNYPLEESSIPIENGKYTFEVPSGTYVTYAPGAEIEKNGDRTTVVWEVEDKSQQPTLVFEYSMVPLPLLPMKGVYLFWVSLIVLLLITLVAIIMKKRRMYKKVARGH